MGKTPVSDEIPQLISARALARRLGVKTETLKSWRACGRGPKNWLHLSETHVVYDVDQVEAWIKARRRSEPTANPGDQLRGEVRNDPPELPGAARPRRFRRRSHDPRPDSLRIAVWHARRIQPSTAASRRREASGTELEEGGTPDDEVAPPTMKQ